MSTTTSSESVYGCASCKIKLRDNDSKLVNTCGHVFCQHCVEFYLDTYSYNKDGRIKDCPACEEEKVIRQVKNRLKRRSIEYDKYVNISKSNNPLMESINDSIEIINSIFVVTVTGKTIGLVPEFGAKTRICRIKRMIESSEGIEIADQILMYDCRNLEDVNTLDYYKITNGSTIYMFQLLYVYCPLCSTTLLVAYSYRHYGRLNQCAQCGEVLTKSKAIPPNTDYENTTLIALLAFSNNNSHHNSRDCLSNEFVSINNLYVKTFSGDIIHLTPESGSKTRIIRIKEMMESYVGIKPSQQILSYNNRHLDDLKTLDYYDIMEGSILNMNARLRTFKICNLWRVLCSCYRLPTRICDSFN